MPKKPPKNAFYFYMVDFKEEQRKKGIIYRNMAEVSEAAGPLWKVEDPAVKEKYQDIAKTEKQGNAGDGKYTSYGTPLSEIQRKEKELKDAEERERNYIRTFVQTKVLDNSIKCENFFVMDVNYFCHASYQYVIAEFAVVCFNLTDGIIGEYHQIVNPGELPMGYGSEIKQSCKELGFEMPNETTKRSNYRRFLADFIEFINPEVCSVTACGGMPPVYTMPDKLAPVHNFIHQMCRRSDMDDSEFRIYKIDTLFYQLTKGFKKFKEDGFPKESFAKTQLLRDMFQFSPGIACEFHEENDKMSVCCLSRAKRWIFTILDQCCPMADITIVAGRHVPGDFDLDAIQIYKEERQPKAMPPNTPNVPRTIDSSVDSSLLQRFSASTSLNSSANCDEDGALEKRGHQPLRMPKTEYSMQLVRDKPNLKETRPNSEVDSKNSARLIKAAPGLTETGPTCKVGLGRGRGLLLKFSSK